MLIADSDNGTLSEHRMAIRFHRTHEFLLIIGIPLRRHAPLQLPARDTGLVGRRLAREAEPPDIQRIDRAARQMLKDVAMPEVTEMRWSRGHHESK
jgi:hypothetical protein